MNTLLKGALVANAASLGVNWIYDRKLLSETAKETSLLFRKPDQAIYDQAKTSFFAYPFSNIGDLTLQGNIAIWLHDALQKNPTLTVEEYTALVYDQIKPGGAYVGWVESYGQKLIVNTLNKHMKLLHDDLVMDDDQLIGFVPYIVVKALALDHDLVWTLAQAFTNKAEYTNYYAYFDHVIADLMSSVPLKKALRQHIALVPDAHKETVLLAMDLEASNDFIGKHVNIACHIKDAVPLAIHILYHTTSYEDAIEKNTVIGGACSDRGLLIGAIASFAYPIPEQWVALVQRNF